MDRYTKCVLTLIAGALMIIAVNMTLRPAPALALLNNRPTLGEWLAAMQDKNSATDPREVVKRAPLVAVCDGLKCFGWSR